MKFRYGIEHESAFLNKHGAFADFTNSHFSEFNEVVSRLPVHQSDYKHLRIGDAGIKLKRWYIEGFERFDDKGEVTECVPKGIEIRTTIHNSIPTLLNEFNESYSLLKESAEISGFTPIVCSYNPVQRDFTPTPELTPFELRRRAGSPEKQTAQIPMMTYGPDLSLSCAEMDAEQIIDAGQKLTWYSPWIIPFSFSSPFYENRLWHGLSLRTWHRTGARPAVMVFLDEEARQIDSSPSLTQKARVEAEVGRIEFKAFDSCIDHSNYASLMALLKGLIIDKSLKGRSLVPNAKMHKQVAIRGFSDHEFVHEVMDILKAANKALEGDSDQVLLGPLFEQLEQRKTPADEMRLIYQKSGSIIDVLEQQKMNAAILNRQDAHDHFNELLAQNT